MTAKPAARRGLGRGLGSLIPTGPPPADPADSTTEDATQDSTDGAGASGAARAGAARAGDAGASGAVSVAPSVDGEPLAPVAGAYFAEIPVGQVVPNRAQPRQVFDEDAMAELVHSIREVGLLQPVVVRRTGPEAYELVMGERRWRASREAGLERIPAIVRETDDTDLLRDALLENLHRSDLNPLEEAAAYAQLLEDFGCTHEELAQRIGRSRPQISNTLRLLKLSPAVQRRVAAGVLSAGHARSLLAVDDAGLQDRLAQRVVAEGISVRGLEEIVAVGETGSAKRPARASRATTADVDDLVDRLADRLETRVKIDVGRTKGKITVEFASVEDLRRIADIMDPRNRNDRVI
ncbi:ParB/RepB/Spo0J family partition protein [Nocardioides sp. zg-579]|uniref:ParB/RepB/Spo0J family partition protein n=1 Tax=Nocardioides marmotae TaxID=2663857 RepID=A0A6I3JE21_9ACTN|nr:ParB/RepB/Spo0J family partition protein [Nocardioides marmotae]MCR6032635.1 ParB/RepB/Spo0J family partition protein [Gordonia jinghuaiqii]MTB96283.1 ParB/RepB/Spo0J family partition protein [Nocardioides marmotae]QKE03226.1 ParB/RepB/Spo0J family partition protein [Nocardioides marmotae]